VAQGSENIGFALPGTLVQETVQTVQKEGRIIHPYIGVRFTPVTPALVKQNNLPVDHGVLVVHGESADFPAVVPGSPAARAGLQEGDIILEFEGKKLDENTNLASLIREKKVGDSVTLKFLRNGQERTTTLKLEEMPQ